MFCELKSNPERYTVSLDTDDIEKLLESGSFETDYGEMLLGVPCY